MTMSTFSGSNFSEGQKEEIRMANEEVVKFNYAAFVSDHYRYIGAVENRNSLRHDDGTKPQIVLDSAWVTTYWTILMFSLYYRVLG